MQTALVLSPRPVWKAAIEELVRSALPGCEVLTESCADADVVVLDLDHGKATTWKELVLLLEGRRETTVVVLSEHATARRRALGCGVEAAFDPQLETAALVFFLQQCCRNNEDNVGESDGRENRPAVDAEVVMDTSCSVL